MTTDDTQTSTAPEAAESESPLVILETTLEAIRVAKTLLRTARFGALATLDPKSGWPLATRVGMSTDFDGTPVILISRLAAHTTALLKDPRCTLLAGQPGKGDALAHARVSVSANVREIDRDTVEDQRIDYRYVTHQAKAKLYHRLGDFRYFRLEPTAVALNAGFGQAFVLKPKDILVESAAHDELAATEAGCIEHMNNDHAEAVRLYAEHFAKAPAGNWKMVGIDAEGMELADGDEVRRVWFDAPLESAEDMHKVLVRMAGEARHALGRPLRDARVAR